MDDINTAVKPCGSVDLVTGISVLWELGYLAATSADEPPVAQPPLI